MEKRIRDVQKEGKKKRQAKFLAGNVMLLAGATLLEPAL